MKQTAYVRIANILSTYSKELSKTVSMASRYAFRENWMGKGLLTYTVTRP